MRLRPYQEEALNAIESGWVDQQKLLLVLPTGTGKTVVFSQVAKNRSAHGRVLIMAHRDELIEQARDKYRSLTGDDTAKEKAESSCIGSSLPVVVGSVQTLQNQKRLERFANNYFSTVIVDEAHHVMADSYQNVLNHFPQAKVLGVTATPDRGDRKSLGMYFDNLAYEYSLRQAVADGYLCKLRAHTIPIKIDMSSVKIRVGDFEVNSIAEALAPYLPEIARAIKEYAGDRKTVVFLPLVSIAQEFRDILLDEGLDAREVNSSSPDRKETLEWFDNAGPGSVLCNAMLLTEGWDCPSVDCVVVLRPTAIRSLYVQMIGRGTRPAPGKEDLLILDFLWLSQKHDLCRPADLSTDNAEDKKAVTNESIKEEIDLFGAASDAVEVRRNKLAEELAKNRLKTARLIDPLQWFVSIGDMALTDYEPMFQWEMDNPTEKQIRMLENNGIDPTGIQKGQACQIIDRIINRRQAGLATARQVMCLERRGYRDVGMWTFEQANKKIGELAAVGWKVWRLRVPPEEFRWT